MLGPDTARLDEIRDEIERLVDEAIRIVDDTDERGAARAYWYPQIVMALGDNHHYLGGSMHSLQDTIDALEERQREEDE